MADIDIIFYDPDIGIEIESAPNGSKKAIHYVFLREIKHAFSEGKSLIIYQHANRSIKFNSQVENRVRQLSSLLNIDYSLIDVFVFKKIQKRYFIVIKQEKHKTKLEENIRLF